MRRATMHIRWHSRGGFLATTLMLLVTIGAPMRVTQGLLSHGALFLPLVILLVMLFGAPLTRLALASGQLSARAPGRDAMHGVQVFLRLVLAGVAVWAGARACGWIFAETVFELPARALDYQSRELTAITTLWHSAWTPALWAGLASVLAFTAILAAGARKKRLAAFAWMGPTLLAGLILLLLLGVFVGYSLQGAGALAAAAAPLRLDSFAGGRLWADAATVSLLAIGAQTGVVAAAGRGLPKRAHIGREARILVSGTAFVLVVFGLAGLLLVSGLCFAQGIVPGPEHAAPGVLLLDVVPALGRDLFLGWPPEWVPDPRRIRLVWCLLVVIGVSFGASAILTARPLLGQGPRDRASALSIAAGVACAAALLIAWLAGVPAPWLPVLTVLPALLAVMRLTVARRTSSGMRVVSVAFHSRRQWLETLNLTLAFTLVRFLLLAAVAAVALVHGEQRIVLLGFAIAFALMWMGSVVSAGAPSTTRKGLGAVMILLFFAGAADAAKPPEPPGFEAEFKRMMETSAPDARGKLRRELESRYYLATAEEDELPVETEAMVAILHQRLRALESDKLEASQRAATAGQLRDGLALLPLFAPSPGARSLEGAVLPRISDAARLLNSIGSYEPGTGGRFLDQILALHMELEGAHLAALVRDHRAGEPVEAEAWLLALVRDSQLAYGTAGSAEIRGALLERATRGRTLLRPDPGTGLVYLGCFLVAAAALGASLLLGLGDPRRRDDSTGE